MLWRYIHSKSRERPLLVTVGARLDALTKSDVSLILAFAIGVVAKLDYMLHSTGLFIGAFYLVPICLACWRFSFQTALSVVVLTAGLSVGTYALEPGDFPLGRAIINMAILVLTPGLVVTAVSSLRFSAERQRLLATRDQMTGALTKHAFGVHAENMLALAAGKQVLMLAFLDLDGFKDVNDEQGHDAGDRLLTDFGGGAVQVLRRKTDCFGRLGGDEFAALLPVESITEAYEMARTLHERLTAILVARGWRVTCSMGVLILPADHGNRLADIMRRADELMYDVKKSGKNGVRIEVGEWEAEPRETSAAGAPVGNA